LSAPFQLSLDIHTISKNKISKENTSTIKKVITVFIALIILPLTLLCSAIGAIMVGCSSWHKKAYKQIPEEQNHTKMKKAHISLAAATPKIINSSSVKEKTSQECVYIPRRIIDEANHFAEMQKKSDHHTETFESMNSFLSAFQDCYNQFCFRYRIGNLEDAKKFSKVLQIKAQEAHRFVPVIAISQFIEQRNLGFSRQIVIANGPSVQEHILVDFYSNAVIFIEEFAKLPNGKVLPGAFAARNSVIEEDGVWYFTGMYLYPDQPIDEEIQSRKAMFRLTYENMMEFMKNSDVDAVFNRLKVF
jgi:hypothetical protein